MGKRSSSSIASEADAAAGGGTTTKSKSSSKTNQTRNRDSSSSSSVRRDNNHSEADDPQDTAKATTQGASSSPPSKQRITRHDDSTTNANENDSSSNKHKKQKKNVDAAVAGDDDAVVVNKRQRRKQLQQSDKNKWPQHPHIKTMAARDQAYLRVAGLSTTKKNNIQGSDRAESNKSDSSKERGATAAAKDVVDMNPNTAEMRWGRCLASTDTRTRHAAVKQLQDYLRAKCQPDNNDDSSAGGGISELDLLKLCKALWYTLYLADHVVVQHELSRRLAELIWCLAGTAEEDEYAGQAYLEMLEEEEEAELADDDDDDVVMEIVHGQDDDDEDEEDEEGKEPDSNEEESDEGDESGSSDEEDERHFFDEEAEEGEDDESDDDELHEDDEEEEGGLKFGDDHYGQFDEDDDDVDDAEIPHCRGAHLASLYIRVLFRTIRREWGHMDKYRVDKFYTLMRLILEQMFLYMAQRHWNLGIIRLFNDSLVDEILTQTPNGLRNHLIDITLEELAKVNAYKAPIPLTEATFFDCLEPYLFLAQTGGSMGGSRRHAAGRDDQIQARVLDRILIKFLNEYSVVSDNFDPDLVCDHDHDDDDDNKKGDAKKLNGPKGEQHDKHHLVFDQVHVGTVAKALFDMASDGTTTLNCYRKSLYDMHKTYMKRLNEVGRDVALDFEEECDNDDEEVADDDEEMQEADESDEQGDQNTSSGKAKKQKDENADVDPKEDDSNSVVKSDKKKNKKKRSKQARQSETNASSQIKNQVNASKEEELSDSETTPSSKKTKKDKKRKRDIEEPKEEKAGAKTLTKAKNESKDEVNETKTTDAAVIKQSVEKKKGKKHKKHKVELEKGNQASDDFASTTSTKHLEETDPVEKAGKQSDLVQSEAIAVVKTATQHVAEVKHSNADVQTKNDSSVLNIPDVAGAPSSEDSKKKRKRDKKKKKKQQAKDDSIAAAAVQDDTVVTISVAEQKQAALLANKEKTVANAADTASSVEDKSSAAKTTSKNTSDDASKRVRFGRINRARSYLASITGLRTMKPPPLLKKAPEEGILLNKDSDPVVNLNKRTNKQQEKKPQQTRQAQFTKSVWRAPMTVFGKKGGNAPSRDLPKAKRRKATDYF